MPHASRVEAELKAGYPDIDIELVEGSGGIFDVICDGKLIYSKLNNEEHRFPKDGEIVKLLKLK